MYQRHIKRLLDIVCAISALIILAIPFLIVATWIKADSRGPIFFRQKRSGKDRALFTMYKFRSMTTDAPKDQPTEGFQNAGAYITRSGKIIRKLSIDELPQLLNVLLGDMSIVGPRPVLAKEEQLLSLRDIRGANSVKPGITGLAQVNGRDELDAEQKALFDNEYAVHLSLKLDAECIMHTISTVLLSKGHLEGHQEKRIPLDPRLSIDKVL
jgi:O-antigen biosynthesis protein WbqP